MTHNRFLSLLNFVNNDQQQPRDSPKYDKLFKIRPLFNQMNTMLSEVYYPQQELA